MQYKNLIANNYPESIQNLSKYVDLIIKYNKVMNLTGFEGDTLWKDGIYESIKYLEFVKPTENQKWADIGSGAGFPCIPYLICNDNLNLTIIEPSQKRVNFLEIVKKELNLKFKIIQLRSEQTMKYNYFDLITARAVTSFKNFVLSNIHLLKIEGKCFLIKGPSYEHELKDAAQAISLLKIKPKSSFLEEINDKKNYIVSFYKRYKHPRDFPWNWNKIINY